MDWGGHEVERVCTQMKSYILNDEGLVVGSSASVFSGVQEEVEGNADHVSHCLIVVGAVDLVSCSEDAQHESDGNRLHLLRWAILF